ncbi:hypothetical protein HMPREF0262_03365 [Clostridium sp. ATCC 29733]|nr:hypothetical protein HMPREF0262_03365 [Clostridium sp. ATCC 29733]
MFFFIGRHIPCLVKKGLAEQPLFLCSDYTTAPNKWQRSPA